MRIENKVITCTNANTAYPLEASMKLVQKVEIRPAPANAGAIQVGDNDFNPATGQGLITQLAAPGAGATLPVYSADSADTPNLTQANELRVSAANAGEKALVTYYIV